MTVKDNAEVAMPRFLTEHLVMTLNNMGMMTTYLDEYTQQFLYFVNKHKGRVLEVGAAYGAVSLAALKLGVDVIANDICPAHLHILFENTPEEFRSQLQLLPGSFPDEVQLPPNSLTACYIARTLGYMPIPDMQRGLRNVYEFLKPGGKLFIITATVYTQALKNLIPSYEQRVRNKEEWPGYFTGLKDRVTQKYAAYTPERVNFLDPDTLTRELQNADFIVEKADFFAREDFPPHYQLDGREACIAIARKPS